MDSYLATLDPAGPQHGYDAFFIDHDRRLLLAENQWIAEAAARADVVRAPAG